MKMIPAMMKANPMHDLSAFQPIINDIIAGLRGQPDDGLLCWAIRPESVGQSLADVRSLRSQAPASPLNARRGIYVKPGQSFARRIGRVGLVPVLGPLVARESRQYFSYDEIARDLSLLAGDDEIDSIILDINSPGGMVSGIEVAGDAIAQARQVKPVVAYVDGIGASAAYWIASAAETVVASQTALIGSVGALISYFEMDGILTKLGARKVEVLAAVSPAKRLDPESDQGRAELQAIVDDAGEMFLETLQENRGQSRDMILQNYGQGLVFAAREARERGLVDAIQPLESLVTQMAEREPSTQTAGSAAANPTQESNPMTTKNRTAGSDVASADPNAAAQPAAVSLDEYRAQNPEAAAQIDRQIAEAGERERERIAAIDALAVPGAETIIAECKADASCSAGDAAIRIVGHLRENPAAATNDMSKLYQQMDKAAEGVAASASPAGTGGNAPVADTPEAWRAEWANSQELQGEFSSAEVYAAFRAAEKAGKVRVLKKA